MNEGGSGATPTLDKASFRYALGHFPTGVTVMTTSTQGRLHGMTVSAFASVSLEPLLILVSVERSTLMHQLVLENKALHRRVQSTNDPSVLERAARRQGMIAPGERAYVVHGLNR